MKIIEKISSSRLGHWMPGIRLIQDYELSWLPKDLSAGITLGMVMVPVGLAFGELAGVPMAGLYAGIFPRMRSMLENLMQTLPQHRHAELHGQLALLDRTIEGHYAFPEDQALARIPDPQGLGGSVGIKAVIDAPSET